MNKVDIYINDQRLDIFQDEEITINLSVQNIQDISKVFTDFTQDEYQKSIYADAYTDVNYTTGKYQSFNINSRNTLTLNTGFVDESYGDVMEEILMSEKVAVYEDGQWVAIVPNRGSIDYQKSINDKTINYTMSFTYAFDQRMLVR